MRYLIASFIMAALCSGCASAPPANVEPAEPVVEKSGEQIVDEHAEEVASPPLEPGDFVLVYSDARFFETDDSSERMHRVYERSREQARQSFVKLFVARVVEDHGTFVEIRTYEPTDPFRVCDTRRLLDSARVMLRFFVRREALALTLKHPVAHQYDDGTGFELQPGLPLEPVEGSERTYRTWNGDVAFSVELPDEAIGRGFTEYDERDKPGEVTAKAPARAGWELGGHQVAFSDRHEPSDLIYANKMHAEGNQVLLTLERKCARITASVAAADAASPRGRGRGFGRIGSRKKKLHYVAPEGTTVYWPAGEAAGEVIRELRIPAARVGDAEVNDGEPVCRTRRMLQYVADDEEAAPKEQLEVTYCIAREDLTLVQGEK